MISVYKNACVAVAAGDQPNGQPIGVPRASRYEKDAESKAMEYCSSHASNCEIILKECSLP